MMGRTRKNNNSRITVQAKEDSNSTLSDSQIMMNFVKNKLHESAYYEYYANNKYLYMMNMDANNFVGHIINKATKNALSPDLFDSTNPTVNELSRKLNPDQMQRAYAYLENANINNVKQYMKEVSADRAKLIKQSFSTDDEEIPVLNLSNKKTNWTQNLYTKNYTTEISYKSGKVKATIKPLNLYDESAKRNMLTVTYDDNKLFEKLIPIWDNNSFSSAAKTVDYASKYIKSKLK
jgi:hypothetical protein